jgi:hypothetical protein
MFEVSKTDSTILVRLLEFSKRHIHYDVFDAHWDNPKCDRAKLTKHLKWVVKNGGTLGFKGDLFCAMQGKYDPRASKSDIRPEHQNARYLDSLVSTAAEWFAPYAPYITDLCYGNHETAILKRHEVDLIERLAEALRPHGFKGVVGNYAGFQMFTVISGSDKASCRLRGYYNHGFGGGGPVTKGLIDFSRTDVYLDNVHYTSMGHVHQLTSDKTTVVKVNERGDMVSYDRWHLRSSTYKEEYKVLNGYHIEKGRGPKPLGGWAFEVRRVRAGDKVAIKMTPICLD